MRGRVDRGLLSLVKDEGSCDTLRFTPWSLTVPAAGRVKDWGDGGVGDR